MGTLPYHTPTPTHGPRAPGRRFFIFWGAGLVVCVGLIAGYFIYQSSRATESEQETEKVIDSGQRLRRRLALEEVERAGNLTPEEAKELATLRRQEAAEGASSPGK